MFCSKCGKSQSGNAQFCAFCGHPLTPEAPAGTEPQGTMQPPPVSSAGTPPSAPPVQSAPPSPPMHPTPPMRPAAPMPPAPARKPNTLLYVLLGVAAVVIVGLLVTFLFILPSSQKTASTLASANPADTTAASVSAPPVNTAASASTTLRIYATPAFNTGTTITSAMAGKTLVLSGIAHNPDQIRGEAGEYTLSKFSGQSAKLVFSADGASLTLYEGTASGTTYPLSGTSYADTSPDGQGNYMRFYLAADGNLYRTNMNGSDAVSDYTVFRISS